MSDLSCIEFRQAVGAEPASRDARVQAHKLACPACRQHSQQLDALDRKLQTAMRVDVPEGLAARVLFANASRVERPQWLAIAASVVLSIGVGILAWTQLGAAPLSRDVIAHVKHEPDLLVESDNRVEEKHLQRVLYRGGATAHRALGEIAYARLCQFRGRMVAHLVLQGEKGPITLLLLPQEHVDGPTPIDEEGFQGVIVPVENGSVAIVGMPGEALDSLERDVPDTLSWGI